MNISYLDQAKERVGNVPLLINIISRRVRQLNAGQRPLVKPDDLHMAHLDIALKEVADGKLTAELGFLAPLRPATPETLITL